MLTVLGAYRRESAIAPLPVLYGVLGGSVRLHRLARPASHRGELKPTGVGVEIDTRRPRCRPTAPKRFDRIVCAEVCSQIGLTQHPSIRFTCQARIIAANGPASTRRPSYLNAWRIRRSGPSYSPAARAVSTALRRRRQRGHCSRATLMTRQEGRESPQVRQSGLATIRTRLQHVAQTGPASGASRTHAHAAQRGESVTDSSASNPDRHTRIALRSPTAARGCRRRGNRD